jgi:hypothetical protein
MEITPVPAPLKSKTCADCRQFRPVDLKDVRIVQGVVLEGQWGKCQRPSFAILSCLENLVAAREEACFAFEGRGEKEDDTR